MFPLDPCFQHGLDMQAELLEGNCGGKLGLQSQIFGKLGLPGGSTGFVQAFDGFKLFVAKFAAQPEQSMA